MCGVCTPFANAIFTIGPRNIFITGPSARVHPPNRRYLCNRWPNNADHVSEIANRMSQKKILLINVAKIYQIAYFSLKFIFY